MAKPHVQEGLPGRAHVIDEILGSLLDVEGHGALILGDEGMGKTSVAAAVLAGGGERLRPFHAFASPVLTDEPYGALAPLLTGLPEGRTSPPSLVLRVLAAALKTNADECAVLVIEDAQFLDDSSAVLLAQLAAANEAKFLFLCEPFPAAPDELWAMCSDGLLKSVELTALAPETMRELCMLALGPQVFPITTGLLCRQAAGNPLFLLELIKHARQNGTLVERNGVWLLAREPRGSTSRVHNVVRNRLQQLSEPQRQALEYVALAGTIDLDMIHQISSRSTVDGLEEAKLIEISPMPSQLVSLVVPSMAEVIADLLPAARTLAIRRRMISLAKSSQASGEALIRYVDWALQDGIEMSDGDVLLAAQLANRSCLPEQAERAAAAVAAPQLMAAAQLEKSRSLFWRGEHQALSAAVRDILQQSDSPDVVHTAARLSGHGGLRSGSDDAALADTAKTWRAAVERLEREGLLRGKSLSEHLVSVRLLEIQVMNAAGSYLATEDELTKIYAASDSCSENRLVSCTLLSESMTATGRANTARTFSREASGILDKNGGSLIYLQEFVLRRQLSALCSAGEFAALRSAVDQEMERNGPSLLFYGGTCQLATGLCDVGQGAMNDALRGLIQTVEALHDSDPGNDLPLALAATAYAASVLGKESVTERYTELFEAEGPGRDRAVCLRSRAYVLAARGAFEGNPRISLRRVADEAAALGMVHVEMDVLTLAIHAGDVGLALRLKAVAQRCEGTDAEHAAAYARALAEKDPMALLAFSDDAERDGRELAAARSAGNAVAILSRRGDKNRLHGAQRLAKRRLTRLIYGRSPLSARLSNGPQLTRRERKVAVLVQGGASNRAIADEFGLSLRTVEGHLYRIFAKLGISDRSEIANTPSESWLL